MKNALIGTSIEALVIAKLTALGCEIFLPFGHADEIDFILITPNNRVRRIQVKKVGIRKRHQYGAKVVRQGGGNRYVQPYKHIDFFIFYADDKFWIVPFSECASKHIYMLNSRDCFLEAWDLILDEDREDKKEWLPLLQ